MESTESDSSAAGDDFLDNLGSLLGETEAEPNPCPEWLLQLVGGLPAPKELASDTDSERSEPASSPSHHSPEGSSSISASSVTSMASSSTSSDEGDFCWDK